MNVIDRGSRWQEILFVVLAFLGLVGTSAQLPAYLHLGVVGGTIQFWKAALSAPASIFLVADVLVLGTAVLLWLFGECRRLGIGVGWAWFYFIGSLLIGISFFVPLFMAHRYRIVRTRFPDQQSLPANSDLLGVGLALALATGAVVYSVAHMPAIGL